MTSIRPVAACAIAWLAAMLSMAFAAPPTPEDRYVAARNAAIEKISAIYDAGKSDDAAKAAEDAAAGVCASDQTGAGAAGDGDGKQLARHQPPGYPSL